MSHDIDLIVTRPQLAVITGLAQDVSESRHLAGRKWRGTLDDVHLDLYVPRESGLGRRLTPSPEADGSAGLPHAANTANRNPRTERTGAGISSLSTPINDSRAEPPIYLRPHQIGTSVCRVYVSQIVSAYTQRHRGEKPGALGIRVGREVLYRTSDIDRFLDERLAEAFASHGR